MEVIKLHEGLDDIAPLLLSVQWCILRLLLTVSDPFMYVQKRLDSNTLTGSLVVPLIWDIRTSLPGGWMAFEILSPTRTRQSSRRH